jgi:hypothetical protein
MLREHEPGRTRAVSGAHPTLFAVVSGNANLEVKVDRNSVLSSNGVGRGLTKVENHWFRMNVYSFMA